MQLCVGTSGFQYREWKGRFYPSDLPVSQMLRYYAERFPSVEINNTFYRMPRASVLEGWAAQVPNGFRFALKAPRRITHVKRLRDVDEEIVALYRAVEALGAKRGPVLFQLPPRWRLDRARLADFLARLPADPFAAIEFRDPSWWDTTTLDLLREAGVALCTADTGSGEAAPLAATAPFAYVRLRRGDYAGAELAGWAERLRAGPWETAYVFFKHEEAATGPALAAHFRERLGA